MKRKIRIDELVVERGLAQDIVQARALIMAGDVYTDSRTLDKAGESVPGDISVFLKKTSCPYVSWGGMKLRAALDYFSFDPTGMCCLDIGASTGGFCDVLLKSSVKHITALDVAYGIIALKIRSDPRVRMVEKTNFRQLPDDFFSEKFDLIVADVSFISLKKILPKAGIFLKDNGTILALIKPQFEAAQEKVEPGGVVSNRKVHEEIVTDLSECIKASGIYLKDFFPLPFFHAQKNVEYFSQWNKTPFEIQSSTIAEKCHL
ncbi:MAG: TlyA family RNA methyltransferase [Candidatus Riflebacteria bacterium]|nr:TlyA family RNA methyltransferase [Candidatus Riflebacteria bacterium]